MSKVTRENLRAYLQRDWASARAAKTAYVNNRIATGGPRQALQYMDALRSAAQLDTYCHETNQATNQSSVESKTKGGADQSQTSDQDQAAGQTLAEKIRRIDRRCLERLIALHRSRF
ncbi:MAG: hypothetical protein KBG15_01990 [Kofleriaceae bacterium]|nr:hypothetical protein [Kofleriaceae bacterium]